MPDEPEVTFRIEEWIPPENAIGGKGFWWELSAGCWVDLEESQKWLALVRAQGRNARLVKVTREVVDG